MGRSKLTSLEQAVTSLLEPRDTLYFSTGHTRPSAAVRAVSRTFAGSNPAFTVVSRGLVTPMHSLVALGLTHRIVTSFLGETYPSPRPNRVYREALAAGEIEIEHWSLLSLVQRLEAGAAGLEWTLTRSLRGSTMAEDLASRSLLRPFGDDLSAIRCLVPDIAFVHALAADEDGNALIPSPIGEGIAGARAARRGTIVTAERIVSRKDLTRHNSLVSLVGADVAAVCEVPFGGHPWGISNHLTPEFESYADDYAFLEEAVAAASDPERLDDWMRRWVRVDHDRYLENLGQERLVKLSRRPEAGGRTPRKSPREDAGATETLIAAASAVLAERILSANHSRVLAGIGAANLIAWIACERLREQGSPVELMAEAGFYGYSPASGDPFIFNLENVASCVHTSDVLTILGSFVSARKGTDGGGGTVGVLGASQVDAKGNINTTLDESGGLIVGSGGANDVAAAAAEILVCLVQRPGALVASTSFVTSPGDAVRTIVTDRLVLERPEGQEFQVTRVIGKEGTDLEAALAAGLEGIEMEVEVAPNLRLLAPEADAFETLRRYDPHGLFR